MNSTAPDFSATFDLVEDTLENTERRLIERRKAEQTRESSRRKKQVAEKSSPDPQPEVEAKEESAEPARRKRRRAVAQVAPVISTRETRRNLNLKVFEKNELRFNELYFKLQLAGDARKKQHLADEALELLFDKYRAVLK